MKRCFKLPASSKMYIPFALLILSGSGAFAQTKQKDALDGKTFTVDVTEEKEGKSGTKTITDEFFFKSSKFKAKIASDNGFTNNIYEATQDTMAADKPIEFSIETKDAETQERFSCEGVVKGNQIEGTAYYIRKGKTKMTYTFTGQLKEKPVKKAPVKPAPTPTPTDTVPAPSDTTKTQ